MALDRNGTRFLLYARHLGVDFSRTAMIGRQRLQLGPRQLFSNLRTFGDTLDAPGVERLIADGDGYAEGFFSHLGAAEVSSFDGSAYEGATHVHDMNQPIPNDYRERYTAVVDGGSLEHVFDFPAAIRNCMEMVAVGGHFLCIAPANNFMGHGFYQFSPELFFRLFAGANGYRLVRLLAYEQGSRASWFSVRDPEVVRRRVMLVNRKRVCLLVLAQRTENAPILDNPPQQSDYSSLWALPGRPETRSAGAISWRRRLRRRVKNGVRRLLSGYGSFDPRLFERLDIAREVRSHREAAIGRPPSSARSASVPR